MTNKKISALTSATTPLAGTEILPIVQSGATVKATVANIVGAGTSPGSFTTLASTDNYTQTGGKWIGASSGASYTADDGVVGGYWKNGGSAQISAGGALSLVVNASNKGIYAKLGNFVPETAGKGIDFNANTPAAGMTSQLLNWYEEGTWTPAQGGGLTVVGAFSSTGKYTRNGRIVTVSGTVTGATSVAVTAAGIITTNLPFTVGTAGHGNATNVAVNAFAAVICTTTNVTSAGAIAATATVTFSATYFV